MPLVCVDYVIVILSRKHCFKIDCYLNMITIVNKVVASNFAHVDDDGMDKDVEKYFSCCGRYFEKNCRYA